MSVNANQGSRGLQAPPRTGTPLLPRSRCAATHVTYAARRVASAILRDAGRWGRTDTATVDNEQYDQRPSSRREQRQSTAPNLMAPSADASGMGGLNLNRVVWQSETLVACSADGRELLVRR